VLHNLRNSLHIQIALLITLTCGATTAIILGKYLLAALLLPILIYSIRLLAALYKRNAAKIAFILEAIDNSDHTVKYDEDNPLNNDAAVNRSLNRITAIMHKHKLETLRQEKYYELIINTVNAGILVIDNQGYVIQVNNEALRLLNLTILTHCRQVSRIDEPLARLLASILPGDKRLITFNNEAGTVNLSVRASGTTLRDKPVRILVLNDMQREMDEQEIDSWTRLIRVLTHEIMNSITPITSLSATLLTLKDNAGDKTRNALEIIHATAKSLTTFVDSYRKFAHIPPPRASLFHLAPFMDKIKLLAIHQHEYPLINIHIDIHPKDLIIYADESLLTQVMLNLLKNAQQAILNNSTPPLIQIKAHCSHDESIIIEVINNGPTIPPDLAQQIFIPFFSTKEGGSGIGLPVSRQIMRLHGGSLTLNTSAANTTFVLRLPYATIKTSFQK
jgi:nitrogen fixation/metabolism regulation signal transduction histidine kinase